MIEEIKVKSIVKIAEIYILRIFMRLLYVFPIKNNRIVINSYRGSQYSCNPKYISEYLVTQYPGRFEIIWAFNYPKEFYGLKKQYNYKLVKYNSFRRFYYEATCKVSINNIGSFSWFPVRKGQEHINTWHGSFGSKKCGLDEENNDKLMKKTIQMSSNNTTLMTATSENFIKFICKDDLGYNGKILKCGYPRNDIFFSIARMENVRKKVERFFSIDSGCFIVLYAPTWRYDTKKELVHPDFLEIKKSLERKFGKSVVILFRMHHLSKYKEESSEFICNATKYPDMQELLCAADLLITDYSTSIWDFAITKKPIVLFTPDLRAYIDKRGLHESIYNWGFPVCWQNDEIIKCFKNLDLQESKEQDERFILRAASFENGIASQRVAQYILQLNDL